MKGLILFVFCLITLFSLNAGAAQSDWPVAENLSGLKLQSGETIKKLTTKERVKVLESLKNNINIEIRGQIIYPDEVAELIVKKLTKKKLSGKRPDQGGYN